MKDKIKKISQLKEIHKVLLTLLKEIEAYTPTSSDELYEHVNQLKQYHTNIISIEKQIEHLFLDLGNQKIMSDLLSASRISKEELIKIAKKYTPPWGI